MKKLIVIVLLMVIIYSCGTSKSVTTSTTPIETKTVEITKSETIVTEANAPTVASVASVASVEEYNYELAEGKNLFESKCANCHDLPNPKSYSAEKWQPIMISMQEKAAISDAERTMIYKYVINI